MLSETKMYSAQFERFFKYETYRRTGISYRNCIPDLYKPVRYIVTQLNNHGHIQAPPLRIYGDDDEDCGGISKVTVGSLSLSLLRSQVVHTQIRYIPRTRTVYELNT